MRLHIVLDRRAVPSDASIPAGVEYAMMSLADDIGSQELYDVIHRLAPMVLEQQRHELTR